MIEFATVVPGTEQPLGIGRSGAARCSLRTHGKTFAAIIKRLPRQRVVAEAFAALLLRAWGAPVPTPYLVDDAGAWAFASADAAYPNLAQRLGVDRFAPGSRAHTLAATVASAIAVSLANAPLVAAIDEAIDNRDRNFENILWDGAADMWIDHDRALGTGVALPDVNKLCVMAVAVGMATPFEQSVVPCALALNRAQVPGAVAELPTDPAVATQSALLATRLTDIAQRIVARFPTPDDLLSGA